jgi:hypothetical protein
MSTKVLDKKIQLYKQIRQLVAQKEISKKRAQDIELSVSGSTTMKQLEKVEVKEFTKAKAITAKARSNLVKKPKTKREQANESQMLKWSIMDDEQYNNKQFAAVVDVYGYMKYDATMTAKKFKHEGVMYTQEHVHKNHIITPIVKELLGITEVGEKRWLNADASIRDKFLLKALTSRSSMSGSNSCDYAMVYYKSNEVEEVLEVRRANAAELGEYLDIDLFEGSQYIFAKYNYTPSKIFLSETNNGLKNSCLYNIIYNATVESFSKRFENYNHEFFQRHILKSDTYKTENIGLSISKTVECICKKYNVAFSAITKDKKQVCKYVPEKARAIKDLPRSINIMVEGKHAYPINNNILEFAHKEFTDVTEEQEEISEDRDEYITMSFVKDDQKIRIEFAKTVEDVMKLIVQAADSETTEKVRISTFSSLENLSIKLKYDLNYTPKITYDSSCTMITSVSVFFSDKKQMITISKPDIDPVNKNENNEFVDNVEELRKYEDAKEKLYDEIFKIKYSSYYGDQEDIDKEQLYPIAPVIDQWEKFEFANGLDYNKYYAHIISEMTQIPVFEVFDNWQPYDGSKIEKHNMYLIKLNISYGGYK